MTVEMKKYKLYEVADYVSSKVSTSQLSLQDYVTTDCLLQNKCGRKCAENLPPQCTNVTAYKPGDILISNIRPYLKKIWYANCMGGNSADVLTIRAKEGFENRYMYYALFQDSFFDYASKGVTGSKMPRGDKDRIMNFEIFVPKSPKVQKKIASVLSDFDKRIENLRTQNRVLEQTAKTIYDYTFLQCADHQTTYNKTLNRNIPANWEVSTIGCYIKESKGGDWGKENPEKNYNLQVSCIRGADIEKMTDLPIRYILAKNSSKLLQEFDLVVEISGGSPTQSTGRSRLMTKELLEMFDNKLICSNFCQAVTMKNPQYAYYISFMWKMFYDNGIFFNFEGKTSGIKNFQLDQFVDTMWFFPDLKTVEKFNAQVAPLIKKQLFNAKQIEALTTQRNTLLPLLMTGQVEV
jgi:type I restriction enzyme S subunit